MKNTYNMWLPFDIQSLERRNNASAVIFRLFVFVFCFCRTGRYIFLVKRMSISSKTVVSAVKNCL